MITSFTGEYRFLSNFYPSPIERGGFHCATVEHAYQSAKALHREDAEAIANAPTPAIAKRLGRVVILRPDWERVKLEVMHSQLQKKFAIPELGKKLLQTWDAELIEGNTWGDRYWGQCPVGRGHNHLGKLLMKVRQELRAKSFLP